MAENPSITQHNLILAGGTLANLVFNLVQLGKLDQEWTNALDSARKKWDLERNKAK